MGMGILGWMRVFEGIGCGIDATLDGFGSSVVEIMHAMLCSDLSRGNGDGDVEMMMGS